MTYLYIFIYINNFEKERVTKIANKISLTKTLKFVYSTQHVWMCVRVCIKCLLTVMLFIENEEVEKEEGKICIFWPFFFSSSSRLIRLELSSFRTAACFTTVGIEPNLINLINIIWNKLCNLEQQLTKRKKYNLHRLQSTFFVYSSPHTHTLSREHRWGEVS